MERKRSAYRILVGNLKKEDHQEKMGVDERITFK
jgi:hypothetical protein